VQDLSGQGDAAAADMHARAGHETSGDLRGDAEALQDRRRDALGEQPGEQVVGGDLGGAVGMRHHTCLVQAGPQPAVGFGSAG
jgi:hypothetical protein